MTKPDQNAPLWAPSEDRIANTNLARYQRWLAEERGVQTGDYESLWRWSVENLEDFWASIWDHFDVRADTPYEQVLASREMPGAEWFTGRAAVLRPARARGPRRLRRGASTTPPSCASWTPSRAASCASGWPGSPPA